jgi:hypothetical protein
MLAVEIYVFGWDGAAPFLAARFAGGHRRLRLEGQPTLTAGAMA